jgi:hypothetical protein
MAKKRRKARKACVRVGKKSIVCGTLVKKAKRAKRRSKRSKRK